MAVDTPDSAQPGHGLEFMDLLAYIYLQHGLPDKAAVLLSARDLLVPDEPRALLTLALARVRSAKPGKALETLERLAILGAMSAEFHLIRAQALHALERHAEAAGAMRAYVALLLSPSPSSPATPLPSA
ncbi:tetratricopeptide repeat protein [Acidovorax sp. CCYZU-2555]|uniref:type III secretion apparatus assembly chaperone SctY n=1 Tax=Acidovorax sp. CCYZU-2555 TaxID=2835042 RepID=UPI001BCB5C31|nr:tetratricopeptide repeat protein [Acidovorax sp. CCYZU-2555]MBS7777604.1 hypothetical protein [Acidovorax sp. CCYZU-2555]